MTSEDFPTTPMDSSSDDNPVPEITTLGGSQVFPPACRFPQRERFPNIVPTGETVVRRIPEPEVGVDPASAGAEPVSTSVTSDSVKPSNKSELRAAKRATAEWALYQKTLRWVGLFVVVMTVIAVVIGWFVSGLAGVWAAVIGAAIAGLFCGTTLWSVANTIGTSPTSMAATVMLTWAGKLVVLIAVLALLRGRDFYNPYILFAVIAVGVLGALGIQALSLKRGRLPYVTTSN